MKRRQVEGRRSKGENYNETSANNNASPNSLLKLGNTSSVAIQGATRVKAAAAQPSAARGNKVPASAAPLSNIPKKISTGRGAVTAQAAISAAAPPAETEADGEGNSTSDDEDNLNQEPAFISVPADEVIAGAGETEVGRLSSDPVEAATALAAAQLIIATGAAASTASLSSGIGGSASDSKATVSGRVALWGWGWGDKALSLAPLPSLLRDIQIWRFLPLF
jgi:hypothetical protein